MSFAVVKLSLYTRELLVSSPNSVELSALYMVAALATSKLWLTSGSNLPAYVFSVAANFTFENSYGMSMNPFSEFN